MSIFSEQINEISKALSKVQGALKHASKDSNNPFFKSKYADLAEVWNTCRSLLAENNLAITQLLEVIEGKPALITILSHESGQWMKSTAMLPISKPGSQEIGSCITYFRRYSLAALVGVYQDDDDGEKAQKEHREEEKKALKLSNEQIKKIRALVDKVDDDDYLFKLEEYLDCDSIESINPKDYDRAIRSLEKKIRGTSGAANVA
jgi:ERF superfamily